MGLKGKPGRDPSPSIQKKFLKGGRRVSTKNYLLTPVFQNVFHQNIDVNMKFRYRFAHN
jgi:hypothetical protein